MKKVILLLVTGTLMLIACSKNDNPVTPTPKAKDLRGTWVMTEVVKQRTFEETISGGENGLKVGDNYSFGCPYNGERTYKCSIVAGTTLTWTVLVSLTMYDDNSITLIYTNIIAQAGHPTKKSVDTYTGFRK